MCCQAKLLSKILSIIAALLISASGYAAQLEVRVLLVPEQEAVLSSQISGRIINLPVKEGERFKKDQTLVELDCQILKAELKKAQMDLEAATETLSANLQLQEFGSASVLEVAISSAKKKRAQAEVRLMQTKVEMCEVKAPFEGRVITRKANPFENINPGDELLEILNDKQLKLHLLIPSNWLLWLKPGCPFKVFIDETGQEYAATVVGLGAKVNPVNQTLEVRAAIKGSHAELLAGMSGTAFFNPPAESGFSEGLR